MYQCVSNKIYNRNVICYAIQIINLTSFNCVFIRNLIDRYTYVFSSFVRIRYLSGIYYNKPSAYTIVQACIFACMVMTVYLCTGGNDIKFPTGVQRISIENHTLYIRIIIGTSNKLYLSIFCCNII